MFSSLSKENQAGPMPCGKNANVLDIPDELLWEILLYSTISDIKSLETTSKDMRCALNSPMLWKLVFQRDFGLVAKTENDQTWKEL